MYISFRLMTMPPLMRQSWTRTSIIGDMIRRITMCLMALILPTLQTDVRIREFKQMVQALHKAGIRVVLDVVYNHTFNIIRQ